MAHTRSILDVTQEEIQGNPEDDPLQTPIDGIGKGRTPMLSVGQSEIQCEINMALSDPDLWPIPSPRVTPWGGPHQSQDR